MWYAAQVGTGRENSVMTHCKKLFKEEFYIDCFVPRCEVQKKYQGDWHMEKKMLFPGYVFFESEQIEELYLGLKAVPELTKFLGMGTELVSLYSYEVAFFERFCGRNRVIEVSKGHLSGDKVVVTDGPMVGFEGYIKKIDRHKRIAYLEVEFFGRKTETQVGLEIVRKE